MEKAEKAIYNSIIVVYIIPHYQQAGAAALGIAAPDMPFTFNAGAQWP